MSQISSLLVPRSNTWSFLDSIYSNPKDFKFLKESEIKVTNAYVPDITKPEQFQLLSIPDWTSANPDSYTGIKAESGICRIMDLAVGDSAIRYIDPLSALQFSSDVTGSELQSRIQKAFGDINLNIFRYRKRIPLSYLSSSASLNNVGLYGNFDPPDILEAIFDLHIPTIPGIFIDLSDVVDIYVAIDNSPVLLRVDATSPFNNGLISKNYTAVDNVDEFGITRLRTLARVAGANNQYIFAICMKSGNIVNYVVKFDVPLGQSKIVDISDVEDSNVTAVIEDAQYIPMEIHSRYMHGSYLIFGPDNHKSAISDLFVYKSIRDVDKAYNSYHVNGLQVNLRKLNASPIDYFLDLAGYSL